MSSKALAKKIEYYVSHGNNCFVKVYMFVNGAELSHRMVKADGVKIQALRQIEWVGGRMLWSSRALNRS